MGTNFPDFLREANRVIKYGGKLFIVEVMSRFVDIKAFTNLMKTDVGFRAIKVNKLKDYFYIMVFEKETNAKRLSLSREFGSQLTPCKYKKR